MDWWDAEREYTDAVVGETTLGRLFFNSAKRCESRPAQQYKGGVYDRSLTNEILPAAPPGEFQSLSYGKLADIVSTLAAGFRDIGIEPGDRVGIVAPTRMEWAQTDFALLSAGAVVTTVYTGSSPEQVRYLLADADATAVVVADETLLERVLAVEDDLDIAHIVMIDEDEGASEDSSDTRADILTLADVYARGSESDPDIESWIEQQSLDDLASIIYTSGTTGQPKGVRLSHRNFRANITQLRKRVGPRPDKSAAVPVLDRTTRTVSYLPLAHVFERLAGHFFMFATGACVAYAESPDTLQEDFAAVEPTAATSVPRVYEKLYDAVREQASDSTIKQRLFEWATAVGTDYQQTDSPSLRLRAKQAIADRLVFSQVRAALGGNVEFLISGGGSLSADLCTLYHAMGLPIFEGYGLTETSPVITVNPPEAPKIGTVGPPVVDCEITIDETAVDQSAFDDPGAVGELLVRGPNVTDGYWNRPEATAAAFTDAVSSDRWKRRIADGTGPHEDTTRNLSDEDRWFRTGDIVHHRPDGYLEFRERAKQLLVLSTGKNVVPGPIEDAFAPSDVIEQCLVVGDGRKFVGALLVPNIDHLRTWAATNGIDLPEDPEALVDDDRVREYIQTAVDRVNADLEHHEQIKRFQLLPDEFTEDNGMLTPTMKKKRRVIREAFAAEIEELYP